MAAEIGPSGIHFTEFEPEAQVRDDELERFIREIRKRGGYGSPRCSAPSDGGFKPVAAEVPGALAEILETVAEGRKQERSDAA